VVVTGDTGAKERIGAHGEGVVVPTGDVAAIAAAVAAAYERFRHGADRSAALVHDGLL
jgi:microcompartment protein CcmL/EutN